MTYLTQLFVDPPHPLMKLFHPCVLYQMEIKDGKIIRDRGKGVDKKQCGPWGINQSKSTTEKAEGYRVECSSLSKYHIDHNASNKDWYMDKCNW